VFAAELAGLLIVAFGPWRDGVSLMGGALVAASLTRAALPRREAGMLGVRGKWFDVFVLVLVGVALMALAQNIPSQP
jgi:hypothetical protein